MARGKFVAYYRVSTARQGMSGLGLDAQRESVARYLNGGDWELVGEFTETETGKGADALAKRPQLRAALQACRESGARLLIAKLDRLARNVHFVSGLMESKVQFVAVDMPDANELTVHIMAAFAEHEAKRISERTKDALAAAKARGVRLGVSGAANLKRNVAERQEAADAFAARLAGLVAGFRARGLSQRAMVAEFNMIGIKTPQGGEWHLGQFCRLLKRIDSA
ncbi:TPA: recombinase family protein [Burkholderia vietnamiensis]|uniref:recombinase family protein n=1 Tax=Burkholderia cepacia complex TaxID=87882 RepID=UPI00158D84F2|nr:MULTISPECIES: recombinase family protein [Burkholderia cepacia complex]MBR8159975.1 recombinase family protein [Burkholderia vietnamiensis]MCA8146607.1 recombinase family protein [Burkholderia vietnamiensis]MCO8430113.1 recombinase family protein [Burkholderia multivorans]MCO8441677.1 recombinase family protein [Burkholderia multivorans]MCO8547787.1 recombinase family protein [Burkholderia multivorans]